MQTTTKKQILENIGKIYEKAKACHLEESFFISIEAELDSLSQYFKTSDIQTFFIAIVFTFNYKGDTADLNILSDYFGCNPLRMLEFHEELENLCKKGLFHKEKSKRRLKISGAGDQYTVEEKVTEAVLQGLPLPQIKNKNAASITDLLEKIYDLGTKRDEDIISTMTLFRETEFHIEKNMHLPLIKRISQLEFRIQETYLFLYLIWKTISGSETTDIGRALEGIYDMKQVRFDEMQKLISEEHILVKNNWVEIVPADFFNDTEMKLTDLSLQFLNDCDIKLFIKKKKKNNVIEPSEIIQRELIFDLEEMKQLETLKNLLPEEKFVETQKRLKEKGLPEGITVLLHGHPGTGKTEVVNQLAKATNRQIMKVDISQTKSKWFAESEKMIKKIFTDYQNFAKDCDQTPILLFNEADAIISKRKDLNSSNVAQTENALQNIILEELENFAGILMATTNLAENLDSAFDRRFLFKIVFHKPSTEVRAKIWKSKIATLRSWQYNNLAEKFDFSGGQIDNIIRKIEIQQIINNVPINFEGIESFCNEEMMIPQNSAIGFIHSKK